MTKEDVKNLIKISIAKYNEKKANEERENCEKVDRIISQIESVLKDNLKRGLIEPEFMSFQLDSYDKFLFYSKSNRERLLNYFLDLGFNCNLTKDLRGKHRLFFDILNTTV